jgi:Fur family ferric uptake transcriptional regulator
MHAPTTTDAPTWAEHAAAQLSGAGFRRGGARAAVVALLDAQACALSAYDIEQALRDGPDRAVARASVYRILDELEELRLVSRIDVGQGITRYEPIRPGGHHHHHMVCSTCGRIIPFSDDELETAISRLAERVTFAVDEHEIVLHGRCSACAAAAQG